MEVFVKKNKQQRPGYTVRNIMGRNATPGDIGLEIEVEGRHLPKSNSELAPFWGYHKDNSLRGEDNAEYVLSKPIKFEEVPEAIRSLWQIFDKYKSRLDDSNRTSVHVHLNCQEFHLNRLAAFIGIYFCFEELITEWCGDHRVGNLFCLRGKDAPGLVTAAKKFVQHEGEYELRDGLHYSGLNIQSLQKFGSLEIRTMRGVTDPDTILTWINILRRFYDLSAEYTDPRDFVARFSSEGPSSFFDNTLGEYAVILRQGLGLSETRIHDSMYEGVRMAQDICYCRDWSLYNPVDLKDDPFGRSPKKVINSLSQAAVALGEPGSYPVGVMTAQPLYSLDTETAPSPMMGPTPITDPFQAVEEIWLPDWDDSEGDF